MFEHEFSELYPLEYLFQVKHHQTQILFQGKFAQLMIATKFVLVPEDFLSRGIDFRAFCFFFNDWLPSATLNFNPISNPLSCSLTPPRSSNSGAYDATNLVNNSPKSFVV